MNKELILGIIAALNVAYTTWSKYTADKATQEAETIHTERAKTRQERDTRIALLEQKIGELVKLEAKVDSIQSNLVTLTSAFSELKDVISVIIKDKNQ